MAGAYPLAGGSLHGVDWWAAGEQCPSLFEYVVGLKLLRPGGAGHMVTQGHILITTSLLQDIFSPEGSWVLDSQSCSR